MMKRRFLICFPYEGDISKINRIADALEDEGIDFVQVNESFTDGTADTTIARGDIEEVKRDISEEIEEEMLTPTSDNPDPAGFGDMDKAKEVFEKGDFVYGYEPGMNRWLPYEIKEVLGDDKYLVFNYQVGAPFQKEDEVFEMDGEELRKQPEDKVFKVEDYFYFNDQKNFEEYVKENSDDLEDIYTDFNGVVNLIWKDPEMKGYSTQATPFWEEEDYVPVQVSTEDGEMVKSSLASDTDVYFKRYDDFDMDNSIYPNSPSSFYQAYVDILPEILSTSKRIIEEQEKEFKTGGLTGQGDKVSGPLKLSVYPSELSNKVENVLLKYGVSYRLNPEFDMLHKMGEGKEYIIEDMDKDNYEDIQYEISESYEKNPGSFTFYYGDDPAEGDMENASFKEGGKISKNNKALITGGLAGILLGIFLNR